MGLEFGRAYLEPCVVASSLLEADSVSAYRVAFIVVFPETHGADVERPWRRFIQREIAAAKTGVLHDLAHLPVTP